MAGHYERNETELVIIVTPYVVQPVDADHLVIEETQSESGHLGEGVVHRVEMALLDCPPPLEVRVLHEIGKHPVDDDAVDPVAEQPQERYGHAEDDGGNLCCCNYSRWV